MSESKETAGAVIDEKNADLILAALMEESCVEILQEHRAEVINRAKAKFRALIEAGESAAESE